MPKKVTDAELKTVLKTVKSFEKGASTEQLHEKLGATTISRRTLQRRLETLTTDNSYPIEKKGQGRGVYYYYSSENTALSVQEPMPMGFSNSTELVIPISAESKELRDTIRLPIHKRQSIGYNRDFLYSYKPNVTFYLPEATREHLRAIGFTNTPNQAAGTFARKILSRLLLDLSWNSSRLEGNRYSLLETERLLESGEAGDEKKPIETQMILNHKEAIEFLVSGDERIGFNKQTILTIHALLAEELLPEPASWGRLRKIPVGISKTVYQPTDIPQVVEECFEIIIANLAAINDPYEQAFFAMVHLPYLQPFEDVNKRVSRLTANLPFILNNLSPLTFRDVPERFYIEGILAVYELNRIELLRDVFCWAYERSSGYYAAIQHSLGIYDPFRIRYQKIIKKTINELILNKLNKKSADDFIKNVAQQELPPELQARFIEVVEINVMSLHEGNILVYKIYPEEFHEWQKTWR